MAPTSALLSVAALAALCSTCALADPASGGAKQPTKPSLRGAARWDDDYDDDRYHDHDRYDDRYRDHDGGHFDWRDLLPHTSSLASWGDDDYDDDRYHDHDRYDDRYHDHDHYGNNGGHFDWRDLLPHTSSLASSGDAAEDLSLADTQWRHGWGHHGHGWGHHGHGWGHHHHGWGHRHHYGHHHGWYSLEALGRDISNSSNMENSEFWTAVFEDQGLSKAFAGGLAKMDAPARASWEQDLVAALDWDDRVEHEAEQEAHEAKNDIEHVGDSIDHAVDTLAQASSGDVGDQVEHEAEQEANEAKHDIENVGDSIDHAVDSLAQASSGDVGDQVEHEAEQEANEAKQVVDNLAASPETQFWDEVFGDESSRHSLASWLLQMGDSKRSEWQQRVSLLATQQGGKAWQPSWDGALEKLAAAQSLSASRWGWGHHHHHHYHHGRRWGGWGGHHGHYHHHHHRWFSLPEEEATSKSEKVDEGEGRRLNMI